MKYFVKYDRLKNLIAKDIDNGLEFRFHTPEDEYHVCKEIEYLVNGNEKHTNNIERRDKAIENGIIVDCVKIEWIEDSDLNGRPYMPLQYAIFNKELINTLPIPKPIGQFILDNVPIEKRVITPNGIYIHYSDVCTLLKKYNDR